MSDYSGNAGAMLLSQQLAWYRWEDYFERARTQNAVAAEYNILRQRFSTLVNNYNRLGKQAKDIAAEADRRGAALDQACARIAQLEAENRRLKEDNEFQTGSVAILRNALREHNPSYSPPYDSRYDPLP